MNIAYYTCFYGSDSNSSFLIPDAPSIEYHCYYFTNNVNMIELLKQTSWIGVFDDKQTEDDLIDSCMLAKRVKIIPHEYEELKCYDYLIFLDSKLQKINEQFVEDMIQKYFIENKYALLLREHPVFRNIWKEYEDSIIQERYKIESEKYVNYIITQISNGLKEITHNHCACGLLIRNMRHEKIKELNNTWYLHLQECGIQDQLSFFFVKQLFEDEYYSFTENPFV